MEVDTWIRRLTEVSGTRTSAWARSCPALPRTPGELRGGPRALGADDCSRPLPPRDVPPPHSPAVSPSFLQRSRDYAVTSANRHQRQPRGASARPPGKCPTRGCAHPVQARRQARTQGSHWCRGVAMPGSRRCWKFAAWRLVKETVVFSVANKEPGGRGRQSLSNV